VGQGGHSRFSLRSDAAEEVFPPFGDLVIRSSPELGVEPLAREIGKTQRPFSRYREIPTPLLLAGFREWTTHRNESNHRKAADSFRIPVATEHDPGCDGPDRAL